MLRDNWHNLPAGKLKFDPSLLNNPLYPPSEVKEDLVNSPQHYQGAGMQVIDVLRSFLSAEEFKGYLKGNILKYQLRCEKKGKATDLDKAHWYQEELKKILNGSHST
jgi:hypothetical protein